MPSLVRICESTPAAFGVQAGGRGGNVTGVRRVLLLVSMVLNIDALRQPVCVQIAARVHHVFRISDNLSVLDSE